MTANNRKRSPRDGRDGGDEDLARLVDELAERVRQGEQLDWPACLKQHPRHAEELQQLAPAIEALAKFADARRTAPPETGNEGRQASGTTPGERPP